MDNDSNRHSSDESRPLDFNRLAWFVSGLIIGNTLHTLTTLVLLVSWIVVTNEPLPSMLGGYYPQNIMRNIFEYINSKLKRRNKNINKNVNKVDPTSNSNDLNESQFQPQFQSQFQPQFQLQGPSIVTLPLNTIPIMTTSFMTNDEPRIVEQ